MNPVNVHIDGNAETYPDLAVAVLAGGASTRFGADKALVRLEPGAPTLIERVCAIGLSLSETVAVIGHARYCDVLPSIPIIPDDDPGRGPLGGIVTALRCLNRPRILVLACDMPCLSVPVLRWMVERPSTADIVIPRTNDGRWQTMHAIYRQSCLSAAKEALRHGNGSVRSFLDLVDVEAIPEADLRQLDPQLSSLFSLNQPRDLERARTYENQKRS